MFPEHIPACPFSIAKICSVCEAAKSWALVQYLADWLLFEFEGIQTKKTVVLEIQKFGLFGLFRITSYERIKESTTQHDWPFCHRVYIISCSWTTQEVQTRLRFSLQMFARFLVSLVSYPLRSEKTQEAKFYLSKTTKTWTLQSRSLVCRTLELGKLSVKTSMRMWDDGPKIINKIPRQNIKNI